MRGGGHRAGDWTTEKAVSEQLVAGSCWRDESLSSRRVDVSVKMNLGSYYTYLDLRVIFD